MLIIITHNNLERVHTLSDAWTRMKRETPRPEDMPGLIRTYHLLGDDGIATGTVQVWRSRHDADAYFASDPLPTRRRGGPTVEYFRVPLVVGEGYAVPEIASTE